MCGRFSLRWNRDDIVNDVDVDDWVDQEEFVPRYNIAPRTQAPVIRRRNPGPSGSAGNNDNDDSLIIQTMKWGLVPHWSKFEDKTLSTTNARSENLLEGRGMWASIQGKKRCAIPCQGYYEWLTKGKDKLPHFTKRKDGRLLLMAGLYDSVVLEGKTLWTFTIVTTDANKEFSWLHDRQPVFLTTKDALDLWLDTTSQTWTYDLAKLVRPYHDANTPLECYQVPKEVGKVGTESPSFIKPVSSRKDGIEAMFSKQREKANEPPPSTKQVTPSTPKRKKVEESTPPPSTSSFSTQEEPPSPSKRLKINVSDDSNQPSSSTNAAVKKDIKSKPPNSPSKRKPTKAPPGNKQITSFFGKS
ncbi:hypothetical protein CPB83DRAFT_858598 [Crepidotus variabilis]|uniref:DUF159-domain-containing protein n=1 Tax=Crepidotus variabilis TaxID=179855 RepID=A0A9P6EB09_9AGAR|nr:hypothetical protein CPB83DRAFT_858598 [Crepidotus variabilis]